MSETSPTAMRSTMAGALRAEDEGSTLRLAGWVHKRRDLGGLVFVDLRDRAGRVQLSFGPDWASPDVVERAAGLPAESVISVEGTVHSRPRGEANPDLATGDVEVRVHGLEVLSEAETPPIQVAYGPEDELPSEELRLRYRYLDLRREELREALEVRHRVQQVARRHLSEEGLWEIETPILTRRTPEGARDYLVPSRLHPSEFYALPQSPQLYKQLLMVSGYDRYFQIARCLRDEDLRADRQPEFTQIDAELSFVDEADVRAVADGMIAALWREILDVELETPLPRMTYREAMEKYGTDKPDLRFGLEIQDLTELLRESDFRIFSGTGESGERIRGIRAPGGGSALSRKDLDRLADVAREAGAAGALWVRLGDDGLSGQFARGLDEGLTDRFLDASGMEPGDLFVALVGHFRVLERTAESHLGTAHHHLPGMEGALDALRRHLGDVLGLRAADDHRWVWITDFPLFEWDVAAGRLAASHHPFTMPHPEDVDELREFTADGPLEPAAARTLFDRGVRSLAYDAVYNGHEIASGSLRVHTAELQRHVFHALGMDHQEAERKFGFLLEAFRYGAPPHGGFAFGVDRLVMLMIGARSLRDVIAFPKTTAARALLEGAPATVSQEELRALHIAATNSNGS